MIAPFTKGNVDLVKQLNMATIYHIIVHDGPISRTRIGEITRIAGASVSKITKQLLQSGLINELCEEKSTGGRRPILLSATTDNFYTLSIHLGRGHLKADIMNLGREIIRGRACSIDRLDKEGVLKQSFSEIHSLMKETGIPTERILGIGLTMPGLVNPSVGLLIETPHFHMRNISIVRIFEDHFQIPTYLDNDIRSLALAEHFFGAAKSASDSIFIRVRQGIGAGIIVGGNIFYGANQNAGEIGHMFIDHKGLQCNCGNSGCLETVASNPSILKYAIDRIKKGCPTRLSHLFNGDSGSLTVKDICTEAANGDELSRTILNRTGYYLGIAIAAVVNMFNPNMIVISGDIVNGSDYLLPSIYRQMNEKALKVFAERIRIVPSQLTNSDTIGGFALIQRALLKGLLFSRLIENY